MDKGQMLQIISAIFVILSVVFGLWGSSVTDKGYVRTLSQFSKEILLARKRKAPVWTAFYKFHTGLLPPFDKPYTAHLQFKLWSDDNTVPLLIRVASTQDGGYSNIVAGPAAVVQQLIVEKETFYVSLSHPSIKWEVGIQGYQDPYL